MHLVQPAADRLVAALAGARVEPHQVVLLHTAHGLAAAGLVASSSRGAWVAAAVLLQAKTVLDNVDGGLARATGRVTEFGRYLDTVCDLVVNVALFAALARHGPSVGAGLASVVLTLLLSADFNAERLYREARGEPQEAPKPPGAPAWSLRLVRGAYAAMLAPQDRAYRALDARLFRLASGRPYAAAPGPAKQRWNDLFSTAALVNLGLSTQYCLLGVALVLGMPYAWVVIVLALLPYFLLVQGVRVLRYRRAAGAA